MLHKPAREDLLPCSQNARPGHKDPRTGACFGWSEMLDDLAMWHISCGRLEVRHQEHDEHRPKGAKWQYLMLAA